MPNVVMAKLSLVQDELIVQVNSQARAQASRDLLQEIPKLSYVRTTQAPPAEVPRSSAPPDTDAQAQLTKTMQDSILAWVETPVPALGDLTPIEAYKDPNLREKVVEMIKTYPRPPIPLGPNPRPAPPRCCGASRRANDC